ncbi:C2 domain-containing protein [Schizophyllum fasciatum]
MLSEDIESIGVLKLNVQSAQLVKSSFRQGLSPEIYVKISRFLGDGLARTSFSEDSTNPHWMERKTILVRSFTDRLHLGVYDYHRHFKHTFLGGTAIDLAPLEHEHNLLAINRPLMKDTKPTGEILLDASFHPIARSTEGPTSCA